MLRRLAGGTGLLGLSGLLQRAAGELASPGNPGNPGKVEYPNFPPRAKRMIFLFLNGGPSQLDMFDPKPGIKVDNDKKVVPSPYAFSKHGQSGLELSELLPTLATHADDLCVIRSMETTSGNHGSAMSLMQTGATQPLCPSLGAWTHYGLGSANDNIPGFIVLRPTSSMAETTRLWGSGFLPADHQGTDMITRSMDVSKLLKHIRNSKFSLTEQREQLDLLSGLNQLQLDGNDKDAEIEAEIRAMEVAYRMQVEAIGAFNIAQESQATREMYGESKFGESCLLARRLAERGVRVTSVYYGGGTAGSWDTHQNNNKKMKTLCADTDQAVGALIGDLKQRGLLEDTLIVMGGEFGRTAVAERAKGDDFGRGHQQAGFSMMLAGGGVRGGTAYGATDELGTSIAENPVGIPDLHATLLHALGINHEKLTFHQAGRHFRLNDEYGKVIREILV